MTAPYESEPRSFDTPDGEVTYEHRFTRLANGSRGVEWDTEGRLAGRAIGDPELSELIQRHEQGRKA